MLGNRKRFMIVDLSHLTAVGVLGLLTVYAVVMDIRHLIIPDSVNLAIFVSGMVTSLVLPNMNPGSALAAAAIGATFMSLVQAGFRLYRGYDGLGLGDVKFIAAASMWIGLEGLPFALLVASASALIYLTIRRVVDTTYSVAQPIPFCPFLAIGFMGIASLQILTGLSPYDVVDGWLQLWS